MNTRVITGILLASFWVFAAGPSLAQGSYPVYGIHFWKSGAGEALMNGKPGWSVELLYTDNTRQYNEARWNEERQKFLEIRKEGFRIILRVDQGIGNPIPSKDDWEARRAFANECAKIAEKVGDLVECIIVGNELRSGPEWVNHPKEWYAVVFNGKDDECVYRKIKSVRPDLKVGIYAPGGWPGQENLDYWDYVVANVRKDEAGKPQIDCFPLHAYSGAGTVSDKRAEDPRYPSECDFGGFYPYMRRIYDIFGASRPVYITETNNQWFFGPWAEDLRYSYQSYRNGWLREAFEAVDNWNRANDLKICALCWYVYHWQCKEGCDQWENALERSDCLAGPLSAARADFNHSTRSTCYTPGHPGASLRFQAENYTNSDTSQGRGLANALHGTDYFDKTPGNQGGAYRAEDADIGLAQDKNTVFLGWTDSGEWTRYETLSGGRSYRFKVRFSRGVAGASRVRFEIDGAEKAVLRLDDSDDNWDTFEEYTQDVSDSFEMPGGRHYIRMIFEDGLVNIDWFELVPS